MNPLTWLLAKLRRTPTPSVLTPQLPDPIPVPVSPPAPLTEAERAARQQQREQAVEQLLVQEFNQAVQQGRDLTDELPAEILRVVHLLRHNQADQEQARQWGRWAELLRLEAEAQALDATSRYQSWRHSLLRGFGHAIGTKLSQHQIEPGMTLDMVLAAFGTPTQVQDLSADNSNLYSLRYGNVETGSLIELHYGVVAWVRVGTATFPEHVYDWPSVSGS
jgi:hypothetical protein